MLTRAREIYRQSKKRNDNFWTEWISRPPAALVVQALQPTRITPNQVTFSSLATFAVAAGVLVGWRTHAGLIATVCLTQLSYILDCADGQLARLKKLSSPAGALLDFLMDEVKAFLLVGAATARLWLQTGDARWLAVGVGGLVAVATGISLTSFMRTEEYRRATGAPPVPPATDRAGFLPARLTPLSLVEAAGRFAFHYPSWIFFIALLDRLDVFVHVYLAAHLLYLGRASLIVLVKLGRPLPRAGAEAAAADPSQP